jgi:HK97 family phage portal protein
MKIKDITKTVRQWFSPMGSEPYPPTYWNSVGSFTNPTAALALTPVWRACNLIANDVARTPAEWSNPNLETLYNRPNQYQSGYDFRRQMTLQCLLFGNSFALINRRGSGSIYEIVPFDVGTVTLQIIDGVPTYQSAQYGRIPTQDIIHLKFLIVDGLWAQSPVGICKTSISTGLINDENSNSLAQTAPNIAFVHPNAVNAAARQAISDTYMKNHTGSSNIGKPLVMAEGIKIQEISSTPNQLGLEIARKYTTHEVSRMFGVPVSLLSESTSSTYGSLEFLSRVYLDGCISHWLQSWQSEYNTKLNEECLFDTDFLVKPPMAETFAALRTGIESGVLTKNEARAILDYDPVPEGDVFSQALNLGTGGGTTNLGTDTQKLTKD